MWLIIYPSVLLQVPGLPFPLSSPAVDTEFPAPGSFLSPVPLSLLLFCQTALSGAQEGPGSQHSQRVTSRSVWRETTDIPHGVSVDVQQDCPPPNPTGDPLISVLPSLTHFSRLSTVVVGISSEYCHTQVLVSGLESPKSVNY